MEGDIILLQDVFKYETIPSADRKYAGELVATGLRPKFVDKLIEHGVEVPAGRVPGAAPCAGADPEPPSVGPCAQAT